MRIRKTSETTPFGGAVVNAQNDSTTDTYSCDYINNLYTYSTNEQKIGTWIDGKPLYKKLLTGTITSRSTDVYVSIGASIDKVIKIEGTFIATATDVSFGINYYANSSSTTYTRVFNNNAVSNSNSLNMMQNVTSGNVDYYVILEYTKTAN